MLSQDIETVIRTVEAGEAYPLTVSDSILAGLYHALRVQKQFEIAQSDDVPEVPPHIGGYSLRDAAKILGWPEKEFGEKLCENSVKFLFFQKGTRRKMPYSRVLAEGLARVEQIPIGKRRGKWIMVPQVIITQEGLDRLPRLLGAYRGSD